MATPPQQSPATAPIRAFPQNGPKRWPVRPWVRWSLILAVVFGVVWLGGAHILTSAGAWLNVGQPVASTDFVLVLPGGPDTRPYLAAALWKAGYSREILLLQCKPSPDDLLSGSPPSYELERRVIEARGVPAEKIRTLETATESTFSDAECLRRFLHEHADATATVVTNDYHTRRTRFAFNRVFSQEARASAIRFVSAPTDGVSASDWWRHKAGLRSYGSEYLKLIFYEFRYGAGVVWCAVAISLIGALVWQWHRVRQ
jgi:uncharacterized SAM-binding protein YcdF (DUF218 family)